MTAPAFEAGGPVSSLLSNARRLAELLALSRADHLLSAGKRTRPSVQEEINRLKPQVERESSEIDFDDPPEVLYTTTVWNYEEYSSWVENLLGYLSHTGAVRQKGYSIGVASEDESVLRHLRAGRFSEAVLAAAKQFEADLKTESGQQGSGTSLVGNSIREHEIEVRCGGNPEDEDNFLEGIRQIGIGAMRAFRNPHAHDVSPPLSATDAAYQVAIFDYLRAVVQQRGTFGWADSVEDLDAAG